MLKRGTTETQHITATCMAYQGHPGSQSIIIELYQATPESELHK